MSGALLVALFAAILVINLAITLAIIRCDVTLDRIKGSTGGRAGAERQTGFAAVANASEREKESSEIDEQPPSLETSGETVSCQACGATNRAGYRYCRWCVQPALGRDGKRPGQDAAATQRPL
jgi:hypothetical protein